MKTNDIFNSKIGIPLEKPVLMLAPMEGITNPLMRELIAQLGGLDTVATEFIRLTNEKQKIKPVVRTSVPIQIQIMGTTPEIVGGCVRFMKTQGVLREEDWLDLNVGCPSRRVNSRGAGAALLLEPKRLVALVERIRKEHPYGPLSIKTRLGFQSEEEFPKILAVLKELPLDFITIHGRTKCQSYEGTVSLQHLKGASSALPYPVIGNGDIWTVDDGIKMLKTTGVRGVMCGRGVIANPFLFRDLRNTINGTFAYEGDKARLSGLNKFFCDFLDQLKTASTNKKNYVGTAKEVLCWSTRNELIGKELFQQVKRSPCLSSMQDTINEYFSSLESFHR